VTSERVTLFVVDVVFVGRMYRCVRCPTAYHANDLCIAAGSVHLSGLDIVCSRHFKPDLHVKGRYHSRVNVGWCFICSKGLSYFLNRHSRQLHRGVPRWLPHRHSGLANLPPVRANCWSPPLFIVDLETRGFVSFVFSCLCLL